MGSGPTWNGIVFISIGTWEDINGSAFHCLLHGIIECCFFPVIMSLPGSIKGLVSLLSYILITTGSSLICYIVLDRCTGYITTLMLLFLGPIINNHLLKSWETLICHNWLVCFILLGRSFLLIKEFLSRWEPHGPFTWFLVLLDVTTSSCQIIIWSSSSATSISRQGFTLNFSSSKCSSSLNSITGSIHKVIHVLWNTNWFIIATGWNSHMSRAVLSRWASTLAYALTGLGLSSNLVCDLI